MVVIFLQPTALGIVSGFARKEKITSNPGRLTQCELLVISLRSSVRAINLCMLPRQSDATPFCHSRNMVIARQGEEIVCPKGTLCGRIIRDAEDRITDDDFSTAESDATPAGDRYVCGCCGRIVAMREDQRWRVYLRRGWVR